MKIIITTFLLIVIAHIGNDNLIGKYSYSQKHFSELLVLNSDYTFKYNVRMEFVKQEINGNYQIIGDSLILNSVPHRDKIIVEEKFKKSKKSTFRVTDKSGHLMIYHLTLTTNKNQVIEFRDCFDTVDLNDSEIKSFNITDTKGLKSPEYVIKEKSSNDFHVRFEHIRVFENEKWLIDNESKRIKPIGSNGKYQDYYLDKK